MAIRHLVLAFTLAFAAFTTLPCTVAGHAVTPPHDDRFLATSPRTAMKIGANQPANITARVGVAREDTLSYAGATYISVKFEAFDLPPGDEVIVKTPDGAVSFSYSGKGLADSGAFYSSMIPGDKAVVQYTTSTADSDRITAYTIPMFARGFSKISIQSICGVDDSVPAKCYMPGADLSWKLPVAYERSRPVARLTKMGIERCTGWLVGSEGHLITNQHCLASQGDVDATDIEFEVESSSCQEECRVVQGCGASRRLTTKATFITSSASLDYALIKLPASADITEYGFLQLRRSGAKLAESIYVPQYPRGHSKRIAATYAGGVDASIWEIDVYVDGSEVSFSHSADTDRGSSGAPILAKADNTVVGLHYGGNCLDNPDGSSDSPNYGIDVRYIIKDLESKGIYVKDMVAEGSPVPTPAPTPTPSPVAGQCLGLDAAVCDAAFFCAWDALKSACERWW